MRTADVEIREYYHRVLPFYDAELQDRGDDAFWTWAASEPAGCRVLEAGAGTGRATRFLARTAGRVVAFDLAPEMAAVARRRLAAQPHVRILVGDLRDLRLAACFDLVAAVDDPFVHLTSDEDRQRAFATVAAHLAPGGRFLLDAAWLAPERRRSAEDTGLVEDRRTGEGLSVRQVWRCEPESRLCTTRFEYRLGGRLAAKASFPARLWSLEELADRCRAAGLAITRAWGDYDRRPWERATSPRLIAEMRRAGNRVDPAGCPTGPPHRSGRAVGSPRLPAG
jgi:SAM-dependent methyltransferase